MSPELVKVEIYVTGDVVPDFDTLMTVIGTTEVDDPDVIVVTAVAELDVDPDVIVGVALLPDLLVLGELEEEPDEEPDVLVDAALLAGLLEDELDDDPLFEPDDEALALLVEFWLLVNVLELVGDLELDKLEELEELEELVPVSLALLLVPVDGPAEDPPLEPDEERLLVLREEILVDEF